MSAPHTAWEVRTASVRGASHLASGAPNQDAVGSVRSSDGRLVAVAMADGHGSKRSFRSDIGAQLAVETAIGWVRPLLERAAAGEDVSAQMKALPRTLLTQWQEQIKEHTKGQPIRPAELAGAELTGSLSDSQLAVAYGATLLVVGVAPDHAIISQLGDGDIVWRRGGRPARPLGEVETQNTSETVSLASGELALAEWRIHEERWEQPPELIMMSTDGYSNSYSDDARFLGLADEIADLLADHGIDRVGDSLPSWLRRASLKGVGDDVSLALLIPTATSASGVVLAPAAKRRGASLPLLAGVLVAGMLLGWLVGVSDWQLPWPAAIPAASPSAPASPPAGIPGSGPPSVPAPRIEPSLVPPASSP